MLCHPGDCCLYFLCYNNIPYTGNNTNNGDANVVVSTSDNRWWYEQLSSTSSSSRRSTRQRKASDPSIVVNSVGLDNKTNTCVPATLILFGVPKEFRCIWKAYMKNIVQINPRINFEAHIHMYSDLHGGNFTNEKNDEKNVTTESPEEIRGIIIDNGSIIEGSDTSFTSISTRMVTSSQNEYDQKNLSWIEERDRDHFNKLFTIAVIKNLFRQGNSMYQAYMSATSHPFIGDEISNNKTYIFLRSDTLLVAPIIIPCNGLPSNEVHIPSWQTKGHQEYNDRTAVAGPIAAKAYARAKSHVMPEMVLDRRNKRGEETLKWASYQTMRTYKKGLLHNPERMLKVYLDHVKNNGTKIHVKEQELNWAQLIRVRAGGLLSDGKRWKAPKYMNESNYC